ncbi:MAG: type I secretion system permease/ATPase, partial [Rhodobacteraceae bacterium]|nr:type I secretion system permease/ATPase [Paracoccaceae bacterium]
MRNLDISRGLAELRAARAENRRLFVAVFVFSVFVNLLMLTGPLFMLQVYDRVITSRSEETLVALFALVAFLYLMYGVLDFVRNRVMARVAARFQDRLDQRVFTAAMRVMTVKADDTAALAAQRDLEAVQRLLASPVLLALFDMPWTPVFLAAIFIFHPVLGWVAVAGGAIIVGLSILNQSVTRRPMAEAGLANMAAEHLSDQLKAEAETVQALGMRKAGHARWRKARRTALARATGLADTAGRFTTATRSFRLFLQSAMLAAGAWLVLQGEVTPGAMIAASIIMGRALAPVEQAVGQWSVVQRAREGWGRLGALLSAIPPETPPTPLPRPRALLDVQQITVVPPGEATASLRMASFRLEPGQALGVIGPSGAGKTTLARAVIGLWRPAGGKIRLDGAALDQYEPDTLGQLIGYLPQRVTLFDGTVAENIARLQPDADPEAIVEAARRAAAHDMILQLPNGYDTRVSAVGGRLSGGQMQRVGLARALFGKPVLLVLDEPNANLDAEGSAALNAAVQAVKAEGGAVMIMAHRPAAIEQCDRLLVLEAGTVRAFGPRDEVLRSMVRNHAQIAGKGKPRPAESAGADAAPDNGGGGGSGGSAPP